MSRSQMPIPSHQGQADRKLEFTKCVWGVISPLLANLYMRRFILAWKKQGWEQKFGARIVNYADDFVILCRRNAAEARERMEAIMAKLKLTVNPQKTRVCRVPEESFEFLGYALGRCHSSQTGRSYIGTRQRRDSGLLASRATSPCARSFHRNEDHIEAHIFVAFLAFCLHATPR